MVVLLCKHVEKHILKSREEAFLVDVEDTSAYQVSNILEVLVL
jgi:hypothetical protein